MDDLVGGQKQSIFYTTWNSDLRFSWEEGAMDLNTKLKQTLNGGNLTESVDLE
jgi:hypothetical protein